MSDGSLSQDEIDALLQGTDTIEMDTSGGPASSPLSDAEKSALQEMLRGVTESQGSNLSILTGKTVTIGDPAVKIRSPQEILSGQPDDVVDVRVDFTDGIQGEHSYIVPATIASTVAGLMMGQPGGELDEASLSAVAEAASQITGTAATAIGTRIGRVVKTAPPDLHRTRRQQVRVPAGDVCVTVDYPISIEGLPTATLTEVFSLSLASEVLSLASGSDAAEPAAAFGAAAAAPRQAAAARPAAPQGGGFGGQGGFQQTFGQAFGAPAQGPAMAPPNVQPIQFANLQSAPVGGEQGNIGLLMDVYMEMTVELGRTRKRIKDILGIGEGTIIELDKLAGEPVDILVNHKLIAKGEVVVIDENFGVRVTEIVSQIDRMNELT
ncbi:MAG TPA: flagellar motor switch phosphatase FliY [Spirochaetia bacterium]|nr:flagellar motor switch phosphatase FliY [Spirochaetia bacterium]